MKETVNQKEVQRELKRVKRIVKKLESQGYQFKSDIKITRTYTIEDKPKRYTEAYLRNLKGITTETLRKKAYRYGIDSEKLVSAQKDYVEHRNALREIVKKTTASAIARSGNLNLGKGVKTRKKRGKRQSTVELVIEQPEESDQEEQETAEETQEDTMSEDAMADLIIRGFQSAILQYARGSQAYFFDDWLNDALEYYSKKDVAEAIYRTDQSGLQLTRDCFYDAHLRVQYINALNMYLTGEIPDDDYYTNVKRKYTKSKQREKGRINKWNHEINKVFEDEDEDASEWAEY